jgi:hypothetical protein
MTDYFAENSSIIELMPDMPVSIDVKIDNFIASYRETVTGQRDLNLFLNSDIQNIVTVKFSKTLYSSNFLSNPPILRVSVYSRMFSDSPSLDFLTLSQDIYVLTDFIIDRRTISVKDFEPETQQKLQAKYLNIIESLEDSFEMTYEDIIRYQ